MSKLPVFSISIILLLKAYHFTHLEDLCQSEPRRFTWILPPHPSSGKLACNFIELFDNSLKKIGKGSFGVVKEIDFDRRLGLKLAVKQIRREQAELEELEILRALSGSGIAPNLYACQMNAESVFLAQDLLHKSLKDLSAFSLLKQKTDAELVAYFKTLFDALFQMFERNILHNDIKPANLMTNEALSKITLIDFGVAQKISERNNYGGTPLFMSFERHTSDRASPLSDLYAAALTIATTLSSIDEIFYNISVKNSLRLKRVPDACFFMDENDDISPFENEEALFEFCLSNTWKNVVGVLSPIFGPYKSGATPETANFTTLLAWLVEYEVREELTLERVKRTVESLARRLNITPLRVHVEKAQQIPPLLGDIDNPSVLETTRKIVSKRNDILEKMDLLEKRAQMVKEMSAEQRKALEKKFEDKWNELQQFEQAYLEDCELYKESPVLLERQRFKKFDKNQSFSAKKTDILQKIESDQKEENSLELNLQAIFKANLPALPKINKKPEQKSHQYSLFQNADVKEINNFLKEERRNKFGLMKPEEIVRENKRVIKLADLPKAKQEMHNLENKRDPPNFARAEKIAHGRKRSISEQTKHNDFEFELQKLFPLNNKNPNAKILEKNGGDKKKEMHRVLKKENDFILKGGNDYLIAEPEQKFKINNSDLYASKNRRFGLI